MEIYKNCPDQLKDKPFLGFPCILDFQADPINDQKYIHGSVLDPISRKIYQGKARLSANHKHLTLHGYIGMSVIGRSVM